MTDSGSAPQVEAKTTQPQEFTKVPVTIWALQFTGENGGAVREFVGPSLSWNPLKCEAFIDTLEGQMKATAGDWIIKGVNGEFYPCKPDIFAKTYRAAAGVTPTPATPTVAELEKEWMAQTEMKIRLEKRWIRLKILPKLAINIMWGALDSNSHIHHPDKPDGQRFETRRGPCFHYNKLDVHAPSTGHRIWYYFPSGRCWNLDVCLDRRGL